LGALNGLSRPIGGRNLAFGCIKVAQNIEHFPCPPVLMMLLALRFRKWSEVTEWLRFLNEPVLLVVAKLLVSRSLEAT
jgi:hypothetical protein